MGNCGMKKNNQEKLRSSLKWKLLRFLWLRSAKSKRLLCDKIMLNRDLHYTLVWRVSRFFYIYLVKTHSFTCKKMIQLSYEANKQDINNQKIMTPLAQHLM